LVVYQGILYAKIGFSIRQVNPNSTLISRRWETKHHHLGDNLGKTLEIE